MLGTTFLLWLLAKHGAVERHMVQSDDSDLHVSSCGLSVQTCPLDQNPVRESSTHPSLPFACYLTFPPHVLADAAVPPQFRCWITSASLLTRPLLVSNVAPPLGRVLLPRAI